ncbi:cation:proton antiporter [Rhabdothermincola sediminis]|uniref:cation:proton antiporter n=1 Tax=Rhabdothermincola sediminis TaxID=2751370 RepID=UPI001AA05FD0|nr:cation:proton antiporter [Rhabdothermincola sediminis]
MTAPAALLASATEDNAVVLLELGAVFVGVAVLARVATRLDISAIPLYLLAGLAIGNGGVVSLSAVDDFIAVGAEIGVVMLLLLLGLEYTGDELLENIRAHGRSGVLDAALNFVPGVLAGLWFGWSVTEALFLGGVTYISSSTVIAKTLGDLGRLGNRETPTILSILVIEDLGMAIYLPLIATLVIGGTVTSLTASLAIAVVAVAVALVVAFRYSDLISRVLFSRSDEVLLFSILGLALLIAGLADRLEISAGVGAFLVGIAIGGEAARNAANILSPVRDVFAAVFFVFFTFQIDPASIVTVLPAAAGLALVTAVTKVYTGWWSARQAGIATRGRVRAGTALIARGEFSIIIAGLAVSAGLTTDLGSLAAAYVLILAVAGPLVTRVADPVTVAILERRQHRGTARANQPR